MTTVDHDVLFKWFCTVNSVLGLSSGDFSEEFLKEELERMDEELQTVSDSMKIALMEYAHCPNCPDQGWYEEVKVVSCYDQDEDGNDYFVGYDYEPEQIRCEFCWTNKNSYFNKERGDKTLAG
jgi:hypothetical protein